MPSAFPWNNVHSLINWLISLLKTRHAEIALNFYHAAHSVLIVYRITVCFHFKHTPPALIVYVICFIANISYLHTYVIKAHKDPFSTMFAENKYITTLNQISFSHWKLFTSQLWALLWQDSPFLTFLSSSRRDSNKCMPDMQFKAP